MDLVEIHLTDFQKMSDDQKQKLFRQIIVGNNQYAQLKTELNQAANALAVSIIFDRLDKNARSFFDKLKNYVMKVIEATPWAKTYQSIEIFQEALDKIELFTFRDARLAVELAMDKYNKIFDSCQSTVHGSYSSEHAETFCEIFACRHAKMFLDTRSEKVFDFGRYTVLGDKGSMLNHNDTAVFFSNDFLLLLSTTHLSDKFGAAGFVFLHEIMHTLVMGPTDFFNPLIPFWTTKSDGVAEQAMKTCTTFPIMGCSPNATFEEDASDMAAYRIAWDFYRKSYRRKTVVKNYESLTKDQLFFYGASVLLRDSRAMTAMKTNEIDPHTNNYQRVNTLMSQMPAFGDAFQCKPTDKMIENKARHCELYGNNAPAVKKRKFSSKR